MDGGDLLTIASHVLVNPKCGPEDARCRTSVNRAYYAVLLHATALLDTYNFQLPGGGQSHSGVETALFSCGSAPARRAAQKLGTLKTARNKADYSASATFTQNKVKLLIETASDAIGELNEAAADEAFRDYFSGRSPQP